MSKTLLLNASYEPLAVVPLKRAVILVLSQKAEVVLEDSEVISSPSFDMFAPKVIRLTRYVKVPYRAKVAYSRKALMMRDKGTCQYCTTYVGAAGTVDHVIPQSQFDSKAAATYWENVVWACTPCNGKKANKSLEALGWRLTCKPAAPTKQAWLIVGIATPDPEWTQYLVPA